ncbi:MAG: signal peptidase I [Dehalococcoidia bacterium]
MNDASVERRHLPLIVWLLLVPLVAGMAWLGLILSLGTTGPLEVTAGRSMEPLLHTGDLAVMRGIAPGQLRLGDVVAIKVSQGDRDQYNYPERVLHRVVDITLRDGSLVVRTKGDNEPEPDPFTTPASQLTRRLDFSMPWLGYLLFYLRSSQGRIALAGLVALFLLYEAVRWMTDTAEELIDEPTPADGFASGLNQLSGAVTEYGEHLRSHTRVVRELGGTTEELHEATAMQREVLSDLSQAVRALAVRVQDPGAGAAVPPQQPRSATHAEGARTADTPGPASLELVALLDRRLTIEYRGDSSPSALLAIGAWLESLPGVREVSLTVHASARYTLEVDQPSQLLGLLQRLCAPARGSGELPAPFADAT